MYCGLRVASTDCGQGLHDILIDGRYGTIVASGDKIELARAIEEELINHYSAHVQTYGAQRFIPELIAQRFLKHMY